jgi:hypothetical protein
MGWAAFWALFSQTDLVTLLVKYPRLEKYRLTEKDIFVDIPKKQKMLLRSCRSG